MSGQSLSERSLRGRLNGAQKNRLRKLRDMEYRPGEIADELKISVRQFYMVYIKAGCPHRKDESRHLWINGKAFREWIEQTYTKRQVPKDQAFCRTCDQSVKLVNIVEKTTNNGITDYIVGECNQCGRRVARFIRNRREY